MASIYLQSGDYATYGLSSPAVSDINAASSLIDAFLQRPEGVVWSPDGDGWPCFMAALTPSFSYQSVGPISPGAAVVVPITGGMTSSDLVGEVVILDRATPAKTEACVITAVTSTSVTLQSVTFAHSGGVALDGGMVISEERSLPARRAVTRISRAPCVRMLSVQGRYAYGRRSQQQSGEFSEPAMLASVQAFGGPPLWYSVNVNDVSVSPATGEVFVPPGIMVANFSDVRLRYVAGWSQANVPNPIKAACAALVSQIEAAPELAGNIKSLQAGGTKIEKFADSQLDAATRAQLARFQAQSFY